MLEHVDAKYYDLAIFMLLLIEIHEKGHVNTLANDEMKERAARLSKYGLLRFSFP